MATTKRPLTASADRGQMHHRRTGDPNGLSLSYRWQVQAGVSGHEEKLSHVFTTPGFYRVALTVHNGYLSELAWRDLYVVENRTEIGTEGAPAGWSWVDSRSKVRFAEDRDVHIAGKTSTRINIEPYSGMRATLRYTLTGKPASLEKVSHLVFWLKTRNEHVPAWQDVNPLVTLNGANGMQLRLTPTRDFLSTPPYNEAREGWTYFEIPLSGSDHWKRAGDAVRSVQSLNFGFDSWGAPPLVIWLDGVALK